MIKPPMVELHVFTWRLMIYAQYKQKQCSLLDTFGPKHFNNPIHGQSE
jgi:hypothetical protein